MEWVYLACAVVLTAAITTGIVYAIDTLKQIKAAAKNLETLLFHIDETAVVVSHYSQKTASALTRFESGWGKALPFLIGIALQIKNRFSKEKNGRTARETEVSL